MDIIRPFTPATGQHKFLIVAINYFIMWVEDEPLTTITETRCRDFIWKFVICRFGVLRVFITDNWTQFTGEEFLKLYEDVHIDNRYAVVKYPQAN